MIKIKKLTYDLNGTDTTMYRLLDEKECCYDLLRCMHDLDKSGGNTEMELIVQLDFGNPALVRLAGRDKQVWFELNRKRGAQFSDWTGISHCPFCGKSLDAGIVEVVRLIRTESYRKVYAMLEPQEKLPSWLCKSKG